MRWCVLMAAVLGCGDTAAIVTDSGSLDEPEAADPDSGPTTPALASGVTIAQVAEFQGVKIALMLNGAPATKRAIAAANKPGLLRVYLKHDAAWMPHPLRAVLDVTAGGKTTTMTVDVPAGPDSTDDALTSTANFSLGAEVTTTDAEYAVRIEDPGAFAWPSADPSPARWPEDGTSITLGTGNSGAQLKLVLVPIRYNADGSGRLPDLSMAQMTRYKNLLYDTYPVPAIDITMHAPVDWASAVQSNGTGWGALLQFIAQMRQSEGMASDYYYYGLFAPASSFGTFCSGGCTEGLGLVGSQPTDTYARAAIGLGFTGNTMAQVLVHEVGHNHGRQHAPCGGAMNVDPNYPYGNGVTGVWGYSLSFKSLRTPTLRDFMTYCQPQWISDYTYRALYDRIKFVNGAAIDPGPKRGYRWATFDGTSVTLGPRFVGSAPGAEQKQIGGVTGHWYPFEDAPGGMLIVPD